MTLKFVWYCVFKCIMPSCDIVLWNVTQLFRSHFTEAAVRYILICFNYEGCNYTGSQHSLERTHKKSSSLCSCSSYDSYFHHVCISVVANFIVQFCYAFVNTRFCNCFVNEPNGAKVSEHNRYWMSVSEWKWMLKRNARSPAINLPEK